MSHDATIGANGRKPLRLWPGVAIVVLQWIAWFGVPIVFPEALIVGVLGGLLGGVGIVLWWLFLSRARWPERLGGLALMVVALVLTQRVLLHESVATGGMGFLFYVYAVPVLSLAFVAWAVASRSLEGWPRWATMAAAIAVACAGWALVRTGGVTGGFESEFAWRWSATAEDRLLAGSGDAPAGIASVAAGDLEPAAWPGFRGARRDGIVPGVRIATDWDATPPVRLWERPVGPGWSSFAVDGGYLYTQEQRGEEEVISCYAAATGEPVWQHRNAARFWESNAGAGPRGTPTLAGGRVYALGGTGILNALDARDGSLLWSRDAAADTGAETPYWGFSGSPEVVDDLVVVAVSGTLAAYEAGSGEPRWVGQDGGESYTSPHRATLGGVDQILHIHKNGLQGVAPADGTVLWEHPWPGASAGPGGPIVQPALTPDGDVLISLSAAGGMRRLGLSLASGAWDVEERWTSLGLKPFFNDSVIHEGHMYGFDGNILACVRLDDGSRAWKGGRYGAGQLVLLPDQDLLLVLAEQGDLALVRADPSGFSELARVPGIDGKTWNHPVVVDDLLLVRNAKEMAAFRLPRAGGPQADPG